MFVSQSKMPENCPPSDAISKHVEPVYRFIENDRVQETDFLNHVEGKKRFPSHKLCEACALSFFTTKKSAENAARRFKGLRNKKIVSGIITAECGIHNTRNNHLNLWVYKNVDMFKVFTGEVNKGENK